LYKLLKEFIYVRLILVELFNSKRFSKVNLCFKPNPGVNCFNSQNILFV